MFQQVADECSRHNDQQNRTSRSKLEGMSDQLTKRAAYIPDSMMASDRCSGSTNLHKSVPEVIFEKAKNVLSSSIGRQSPRIGVKYQANIPECNPACNSAGSDNSDRLLWNPSNMLESEVDDYLQEARDSASTSAQRNCPTEEDDLLLLTECKFKTEEALRRKKLSRITNSTTLSLWSERECVNFESGLKIYKKNFHMIQKKFCKSRSIEELVNFYYLWKKTDRGLNFCNKHWKRNFSSPNVIYTKDVDKENAPYNRPVTRYLERKRYQSSCKNLSLPGCSFFNIMCSSQIKKSTVLTTNSETCIALKSRSLQVNVSGVASFTPEDASLTLVKTAVDVESEDIHSEKFKPGNQPTTTVDMSNKGICSKEFKARNFLTTAKLKSIYNTRFKSRSINSVTNEGEDMKNQKS